MFWNKKKTEEEQEFVWRTYKDKSYEELEQEVDNAYNEFLRKRNAIIAVVVVILLILFHDVALFWVKFGVPHLPKYQAKQEINIDAEPRVLQTNENLIKYKTLEHNDEVELRKRGIISISGRIVVKDYLFWTNYLPGAEQTFKSTALFDVGLAWGKMGDRDVLKSYRFYSVKNVKENGMRSTLKLGVSVPPVPWPYAKTHSLYVHVVPASPAIMSALIYARKNQAIKLEGYLVDVKGKDDKWTFTGGGNITGYRDNHSSSSEIVLVKRLQIGKRVYR